jgi:hypothetical protein
MDVEIMIVALHTHWAWNLRAAEDKPWSIFAVPIDNRTCQIIDAASKVRVKKLEVFFLYLQMDQWEKQLRICF